MKLRIIALLTFILIVKLGKIKVLQDTDCTKWGYRSSSMCQRKLNDLTVKAQTGDEFGNSKEKPMNGHVYQNAFFFFAFDKEIKFLKTII